MGWLLSDIILELAKPFYVGFLTSKKGTLSLNESFECFPTKYIAKKFNNQKKIQ